MNIFETLSKIQRRQRQDYQEMMQGLASLRDSVHDSVGKVEQSLQHYQQESEAMFDAVRGELEGFSTRLQPVKKKAHTHSP